MIDLRQLRYFVAIVENGSFSRAAEILHVAQPALSLHVRNMETELDVNLLLRTSRGVEPTEAGIILLRHARIMLDQLAIAEEEIRNQQSDPAGEVRLGLPGTIAQIVAVPLITAVHQRYPKIKLRIAEAMSGFVLDWMRDGRVDLAILYGDIKDHGIVTEQLLEEDLYFFGAASLAQTTLSGETATFAEVTKHPLILPGKGHGLRELLQQKAEQSGYVLNAMIDVDSYSNIKSLVEADIGFSILPESAISSEVEKGRLCRWSIIEPRINRGIHLAHLENRPMTHAVAAVLELTREILCDLAANGKWIGARIV